MAFGNITLENKNGDQLVSIPANSADSLYNELLNNRRRNDDEETTFQTLKALRLSQKDKKDENNLTKGEMSHAYIDTINDHLEKRGKLDIRDTKVGREIRINKKNREIDNSALQRIEKELSLIDPRDSGYDKKVSELRKEIAEAHSALEMHHRTIILQKRELSQHKEKLTDLELIHKEELDVEYKKNEEARKRIEELEQELEILRFEVPEKKTSTELTVAEKVVDEKESLPTRKVLEGEVEYPNTYVPSSRRLTSNEKDIIDVIPEVKDLGYKENSTTREDIINSLENKTERNPNIEFPRNIIIKTKIDRDTNNKVTYFGDAQYYIIDKETRKERRMTSKEYFKCKNIRQALIGYGLATTNNFDSKQDFSEINKLRKEIIDLVEDYKIYEAHTKLIKFTKACDEIYRARVVSGELLDINIKNVEEESLLGLAYTPTNNLETKPIISDKISTPEIKESKLSETSITEVEPREISEIIPDQVLNTPETVVEKPREKLEELSDCQNAFSKNNARFARAQSDLYTNKNLENFSKEIKDILSNLTYISTDLESVQFKSELAKEGENTREREARDKRNSENKAKFIKSKATINENISNLTKEINKILSGGKTLEEIMKALKEGSIDKLKNLGGKINLTKDEVKNLLSEIKSKIKEKDYGKGLNDLEKIELKNQIALLSADLVDHDTNFKKISIDSEKPNEKIRHEVVEGLLSSSREILNKCISEVDKIKERSPDEKFIKKSEALEEELKKAAAKKAEIEKLDLDYKIEVEKEKKEDEKEKYEILQKIEAEKKRAKEAGEKPYLAGINMAPLKLLRPMRRFFNQRYKLYKLQRQNLCSEAREIIHNVYDEYDDIKDINIEKLGEENASAYKKIFEIKNEFNYKSKTKHKMIELDNLITEKGWLKKGFGEMIGGMLENGNGWAALGTALVAAPILGAMGVGSGIKRVFTENPTNSGLDLKNRIEPTGKIETVAALNENPVIREMARENVKRNIMGVDNRDVKHFISETS